MSHLISFTFDDGFRATAETVAKVYEERGLRASFSVLAAPDGNLARLYRPTDQIGDFGFWREMIARGHEITIHGFQHLLLTELSPEAYYTQLMLAALAFEEYLGLKRSETVFNYPFGQSNPDTEEMALTIFGALRTGHQALNPVPTSLTRRITMESFGPDHVEEMMEISLGRGLAEKAGWLNYGLHVVDEPGWGAISGQWLAATLDRLLSLDIRILSIREALSE